MQVTFLKSCGDDKSFKLFENFGADVYKIEDLEKTDEKLKELINKKYTTIIITNEVAGFSESIIKKYNKTDEIKIIIAPPK